MRNPIISGDIKSVDSKISAKINSVWKYNVLNTKYVVYGINFWLTIELSKQNGKE